MDSDTGPPTKGRILRRVIAAFVLLASFATIMHLAWRADKRDHYVATVTVSDAQGNENFSVELNEEIGPTVLIHCSEDRFAPAFNEFRNHLDIETPSLPIPGGPFIIARLPAELPEGMANVQRSVVEILKRHSPSRVIFVAHRDCLVYDTVSAWQNKLHEVKNRQVLDLEAATAVIREWFPKARVEAYYADLKDGRLIFEPQVLQRKE
jgi:hypothetical protein